VTIEVAPGIVVVETSVADGKVGAIAGNRVALAVDAGIDEIEGAAVADAVRALGHVPDRVLFTHAHIDHALGGIAFRGGEVFATTGIGAHMRAQLPAWAERRGEAPAELEARIGWPTIVYGGDLDLDLGGRIVRALDTPGHAPGAVCVHVPDAGVLFGGDTVVTGILPSFTDGDSDVLEATLRRLALLDLEVLVPGHGPIVRGGDAIRESMLWIADYLARCRRHVRDRPCRADVDEIVAGAPFEEFVGDRLPADRHRMPWRHEQTIRRMILERERDT
jgi:glyoxylase-like metal-dependent hydrolase (beta-lactamase superfamily II)